MSTPTQLAVVSASTPDIVWARISDYSRANHLAWSAMHAAGSVMDTLDACAGRPPSWDKLTVLRKYAGREHAVIWMDADCVFRHDATPAHFTPEPGKIRFIRDLNGLNCGVMVFPPELWVSAFLRTWYDCATREEIYDVWWEQKTLHRLAASAEYRPMIGTDLDRSVIVHAAGIKAPLKKCWLQTQLRGEPKP